jgi:hypothetical protein
LNTIEEDTIPALFQTQTYKGVETSYPVTLTTSQPGGAVVTGSYWSSSTSGAIPFTVLTTENLSLANGVYSTDATPFLLTFSYTAGSYSYSRTFQIDLQHQIAIPYTSGAQYPQTSFSNNDSTYQSGISFAVTPASGDTPPSFTISFQSTIPIWPAGID